MLTTSRIITMSSTLVLLLLSAASASGACSNASFQGHYAHLIQGVFGPGTAPFAQTYAMGTPYQGIQMLQFDGMGGITGKESLVAGGGEVTLFDNDEHSRQLWAAIPSIPTVQE